MADFHKDGLYGEVGDVVRTLMYENAYVATKYIDKNFIVRATRKLYKIRSKKNGVARRIIDKRSNAEILLTIGKPNYLEREFIKNCKKVGEPFPIKKIQLKFPPKTRAK